MSIWGTNKNLDLVNQFASFIDLVTNPDKFKDQVKEAQKVVADMKVYVEAKTKVDEADKYLEEAKVLREKIIDDLDKLNQAFEKKVEASEADLDKAKNAIAEQEKTLKDLSKFIVEKRDIVDKDEAANSARSKELSDWEKKLEIKESELNKKEEELKEKATKLKAILGE